VSKAAKDILSVHKNIEKKKRTASRTDINGKKIAEKAKNIQ
jgi:hypothetical protein